MTRSISLSNRVWARNGVRTDPDLDTAAGANLLTVEGGHIESQGPFAAHMNFEQWRTSALLNEVEQDGILEWSPETNYGLGSLAKIGKLLYQSLSTNNKNNPPTTSPSNWNVVPLGSLPTNYVVIAATIANARGMEGLVNEQVIEIIQPGYAGRFRVDANDVSTGDDGYDVLVTTDGRRLKRIEPAAPVTITGDTTLSISHNRRVLRVTTAAVITLPNDLPAGFTADIKRAGTGAVSFVVDGEALEADGNAIASQYGWASVYRDGPGFWSLFGDLETV